MDIVGGAENSVGARQHGRPGLDHEALIHREIIGITKNTIGPGNQGIIGLQWYKDEAVAALGDEVETMVEKLAEEGEPGIEGCRKAEIGRGILEKEDLPVVGGTEGLIKTWASDELYPVF